MTNEIIELNDEYIIRSINDFYFESMIIEHENVILNIMKLRQEKYPSEINDEEWLNFTNFVCRRRCKNAKAKDDSTD